MEQKYTNVLTFDLCDSKAYLLDVNNLDHGNIQMHLALFYDGEVYNVIATRYMMYWNVGVSTEHVADDYVVEALIHFESVLTDQIILMDMDYGVDAFRKTNSRV